MPIDTTDDRYDYLPLANNRYEPVLLPRSPGPFATPVTSHAEGGVSQIILISYNVLCAPAAIYSGAAGAQEQ